MRSKRKRASSGRTELPTTGGRLKATLSIGCAVAKCRCAGVQLPAQRNEVRGGNGGPGAAVRREKAANGARAASQIPPGFKTAWGFQQSADSYRRRHFGGRRADACGDHGALWIGSTQ